MHASMWHVHATVVPCMVRRAGAREARRMSSCESAVFVWATSAAAAQWPATDEAEAELRAAMRGTIPRKLKRVATKANKAAYIAKKKRKKRNRNLT